MTLDERSTGERSARMHSRDEVVTVQARGLAPDVASPATPPKRSEAALKTDQGSKSYSTSVNESAAKT